MQHEITAAQPLLDEKGNLREAGYCKKLLPIYRRRDIKAGALRIKEWDYYLVNNGHFAVALTIADNGYMGLDSISLLNLDEGWEKTKSPMRAFPLGKTGLPESSETGDVSISGKGYHLSFRHDGPDRVLDLHMEDFLDGAAIDGRLRLTDEPEESMVICTPFSKAGHFYYNQKINCLRARGTVTAAGRTYTFDPADSFAVLDWGRGDFLAPWTFTSDDGRFEMAFTPVLDRAACTDFKLLKSDQHQVFGRFTGTATLDDGTVLRVEDFPGFAEKVENKW